MLPASHKFRCCFRAWNTFLSKGHWLRRTRTSQKLTTQPASFSVIVTTPTRKATRPPMSANFARGVVDEAHRARMKLSVAPLRFPVALGAQSSYDLDCPPKPKDLTEPACKRVLLSLVPVFCCSFSLIFPCVANDFSLGRFSRNGVASRRYDDGVVRGQHGWTHLHDVRPGLHVLPSAVCCSRTPSPQPHQHRDSEFLSRVDGYRLGGLSRLGVLGGRANGILRLF